MDIRRLRYFIAVAEILSFSRAAQALGITQPPLSQRIKELESELKVELLVRGKRGLAITPRGARLLELARPLVEEFDNIIGGPNRPQAITTGEALTNDLADLEDGPYPGFLATQSKPHSELHHPLAS